MNQTELQKTGNGYTVATVGNLATFEGKAFVKDIVGTTGMEVSFGTLAPGQAIPFNHYHKQNEELYIVVSGTGVFTLDGIEEPVASGSLVRIAPAVSRCTKNTGNTPLVYICIQAKEGSLEQYTATQKSIPDISQKMLTTTLRDLEADGFIIRKVYPEVPPRTEYSMTPRACSFMEACRPMIQWAIDNFSAIIKDRESRG